IFKIAITETMECGHYFCDRMVANFIRNGMNKERIPIGIKFTEQELNFLKLCCSPITYKAMENEMKCTHRQIEYLREKMFEKLNVLSRTELAVKVVRLGMVVL